MISEKSFLGQNIVKLIPVKNSDLISNNFFQQVELSPYTISQYSGEPMFVYRKQHYESFKKAHLIRFKKTQKVEAQLGNKTVVIKEGENPFRKVCFVCFKAFDRQADRELCHFCTEFHCPNCIRNDASDIVGILPVLHQINNGTNSQLLSLKTANVCLRAR
jgi:hypothetical protein